MNFSRPAAGALLASLLLLSACERPERDSDRAQRAERAERSDWGRQERRQERAESKALAQTRTVENFDSIELRGAAELHITVGPPASLNLDASERTLKYVETQVKGDTLIIDVTKSRGWFSNQGYLRVTITTPMLKSLESNGAGDIDITGLNGGEQTLELAGAHNVKAEGHLDKLTLELSGAGNVDYKNVIVADARVTVNGAGNVDVHATESLDAEVNGVGAVSYSGDPKKVESELHGLGAITRRDGDRRSDSKFDNKSDSKPASKPAAVNETKKDEASDLQLEK